MNMFHAFIELDEAYNDRHTLIADIKKAGKNYNFDKYTDAQLFRMWQRLQTPKLAKKEPVHELDLDFEPVRDFDCCDFCGERLTDLGQCPVCELGEDDLVEWVLASGQPAKTSSTASQAMTNTIPQNVKITAGKYMVGIVSDKGRLRAMGDDGEHGVAFVAFPNNLRQFEGQQYEVDQLIWNGKNYRVAGNIVEI